MGILTEWDEFKTLPYNEFYAAMMKPAFIFDGRSILDHGKLASIGFEVHAIGKGRTVARDAALDTPAATSAPTARVTRSLTTTTGRVILVTGAAGFVGLHCALALAKRGDA